MDYVQQHALQHSNAELLHIGMMAMCIHNSLKVEENKCDVLCWLDIECLLKLHRWLVNKVKV